MRGLKIGYELFGPELSVAQPPYFGGLQLSCLEFTFADF
jgi:hypothetical protein